MIKNNILETIGETPLVRLNNIAAFLNLKGELYAKVESFNPGASIKDRVAIAIMEKAEREGLLNRDTVIMEATSGNTGIALAMYAAVKKYHLILVMPESMSLERRQLLKAYGVELVLTSAALGMQGCLAKLEELKKEYPKHFIADQFNNEACVDAHYEHTAAEIVTELNNFDYFVAGFGTGGTISGCAKYFKDRNLNIKVVGVEPLSSPLLTEGKSGPHKIQGIGANFIPTILRRDLIDEVVAISDADAYEYSNLLAKQEGILCGISAGAALKAAVDIAKQENKKIVLILPDTGMRYLSMGVYDA